MRLAIRACLPFLGFCAILLFAAIDAPAQSPMQVKSSAFTPGGAIPGKYTCSGDDVSPPLEIINVPDSAKALALIVEDPDAPSGNFVHWVVYNLAPQTRDLKEGVKPGDTLAGGAVQGRNDFGRSGYGGPCPPPGSPHHYHFRVFALNSTIQPQSGSAPEVQQAMQGHVVSSAETVGTFGR